MDKLTIFLLTLIAAAAFFIWALARYVRLKNKVRRKADLFRARILQAAFFSDIPRTWSGSSLTFNVDGDLSKFETFLLSNGKLLIEFKGRPALRVGAVVNSVIEVGEPYLLEAYRKALETSLDADSKINGDIYP